MTYRCPLGNIQPVPFDAEGMKSRAWHDHGVVVINSADDRLHWMEKELLIRLGDRIYGERKGSQD